MLIEIPGSALHDVKLFDQNNFLDPSFLMHGNYESVTTVMRLCRHCHNAVDRNPLDVDRFLVCGNQTNRLVLDNALADADRTSVLKLCGDRNRLFDHGDDDLANYTRRDLVQRRATSGLDVAVFKSAGI